MWLTTEISSKVTAEAARTDVDKTDTQQVPQSVVVGLWSEIGKWMHD
nr:hypothetical protein [Niallia taxi]